ncbi:MAG: Rpn family recombination-promoting nuclease/putative transposase [Holosporaceae bacterium]|nr:Rpn family recombination-promoting nuclease/putative transposase [Holosporaceae bacterium]
MDIEITTEYASPLLNTGFKMLMSLDGEGGDSVAVSILNSLVPDFRDNPIKSLKAAHVDLPVIKEEESCPLSMDYHAINERGEHALVEIQLKRHIRFDERALFYAARVYSNQLKASDLAAGSWFKKLKKTYSIQIVNYNSNLARGINDPELQDTLIDRVAQHPMKDEDFIKHYVMTDRFSGQEIDHLQLIQVELPRADALMNLFPPTRDFTVQQWWLSIFRHTNEYTSKYIEKLYREEIMPHEIYEGLGRIKFDKWDPTMQSSYTKDLQEIHKFYAPQIAMDINEARIEGIAIGEKKGKAEEKREMALNAVKMGLSVEQVAQLTGLSVQEIENLNNAHN